MDDRYGHPHNHHHHQQYSDNPDDQPPPHLPPPSFHHPPPPRPDFPPPYPPPPFYDNQPPPPPAFSSYPDNRPAYHPPEQSSDAYHSSGSHYAPPPDARVSHAQEEEDRHRFRPHMPGFIESHVHAHSHHSEGGSAGPDLSSKPSVRVYTKAETNYSLAIREGKVVLSRSDPNDPTQHWFKDEKFSTKVKDQDGYPAFALVNKSTGQAMKHSVTANHPVQLIPYTSDVLDESILWTVGKDLGSDYRQIRMVNNTSLVVDAFNGAKKHGGVHEGTPIMLWAPGKGDNQRWHIIPYCKSPSSHYILLVLIQVSHIVGIDGTM